MRSIVLVVLMFAATNAHAYVGPGLGLGAIGALLGIIMAIALAVAGFIWYPVKRLLRKKKPSGDGSEKKNNHGAQKQDIKDAPTDEDQ